MNPLLERSDMAPDSKGVTQFYLPPTHEPCMPLLPFSSLLCNNSIRYVWTFTIRYCQTNRYISLLTSVT